MHGTERNRVIATWLVTHVKVIHNGEESQVMRVKTYVIDGKSTIKYSVLKRQKKMKTKCNRSDGLV